MHSLGLDVDLADDPAVIAAARLKAPHRARFAQSMSAVTIITEPNVSPSPDQGTSVSETARKVRMYDR